MKGKQMKDTLKISVLLAAMLAWCCASASVQVYDSSGKLLGSQNAIKCAPGLACSVVNGQAQVSVAGPLSVTGSIIGDGTGYLKGFSHSRLSISGDLSAANCGSSMSSDGTAIFNYNLPAASSVPGCRYTFMVGAKSGLNGQIIIRPKVNTDKILIATASAGHAISDDAIGASVTVEALSSNQWSLIGSPEGTWIDTP